MGNVLSAQIPNQILPVEAYLTDIADVQFVESLGSTRFMKVARVEHAEGPYVLKVFLLQDPSFCIEPYRDQVIQIRDLLTTSFNCCPFKRVYVTSRCVILSRRFHKYTLYDRLTTRPYFAEVEKRWITFQLFKALAQCEAADVCHGDIKSQNILVSSSNWVQIGDFASFKPSNIPSDDPSYFTFFFDTSRRLCCYLAPERFCTSQELNLHPNLPGEFMDVSKGLTHAMDIFSLGCVLAEMFSEGKCPFTYEMLVKYKHASDTEAQVFIQNMQEKVPKDLRRLIGLMLHRNPAKRPKASQLLQKYAPTIFPPIFDHFLYNYMNAFRPRYVPTGVSPEEQQTFVAMEADDVIAKLTTDLDKIMGHLKEKPQMDGKPVDQTPAGLLIISLITSNMRAAKTIASKFEALKLLHRFSSLLDADVVADRILPYMVDVLSDGMVQVRCEAVNSITTLLSSFKEIPPHETRLFIDYLFPRLKFMSSDNHHFVQMTLAQNLGDLAEISYRFMHEGSRSLSKDLLGDSILNEMDAKDREEKLARHEMKALQEAVIDIFVNLCGSGNSVKHCVVMQHSLYKLCQFFDRRKSTDVLLSHIITFLNDKVDWRLRATFFECCPTIAQFVGRQSTYILKSLLQQGLHDFEEFVQLQALWCICKLCEHDLLEKSAIYELLKDVIPFLAHPNEYLRMATLNVLSILDSKFSVADTLCRVMPDVEPFLRERLIKLRNKYVVRASLLPPVPRPLWSYVLEHSSVEQLMEYLGEKQMFTAMDGGPDSVFAGSKQQLVPTHLESCLKRLENLGLNENVEDKLYRFENIITKIASFRASLGGALASGGNKGIIDLGNAPTVQLRKYDLSSGHKALAIKSESQPKINVIWKSIFSDDSTFSPEPVHLNDLHTDPTSRDTSDTTFLPSEFSNLYIARPNAVRSSACGVMLSELLSHKRERYLQKQQWHPVIYSGSSSANSFSSLPPHFSRVGTILISHLHEHKGSINKLALSPDGCNFASASSDGTAKLWSLNRIQSELSTVVRADATFSYSSQKISSVQYMGVNGLHLAIASEDSRVSVVDVKKTSLLTTIGFDKDEEGSPVDLYAVGNLLYVLTHHSNVFCFDCRMPNGGVDGEKPKAQWRHRIKNAYGLITSFCIDPMNQNWMLLTSTNRYAILWDLRFGIEVNSWPHPNDSCRMVRCWPAYALGDHHSSACNEVWTAASCSFELSRWKLETAQRTHVIWASTDHEPLDYVMDKHVTTALATCPLTGRVYTGDSFGTLRSYNLNNPRDCIYLSGRYKRSQEAIASKGWSNACVTFQKVERDGIEIIRDVVRKTSSEKFPMLSPLDVQTVFCHQSPITDLLCCGEYLISSSRDGVIKVWK